MKNEKNQETLKKYRMIIQNEEGEEVFNLEGTTFIYALGRPDPERPGVIESARGCFGHYPDITRIYLALGGEIHRRFVEVVEKTDAEIAKAKAELEKE